jgi:RNA polymerase sigma-70 factor (ECF subfamily)
VNSALQRARTRLDEVAVGEDQIDEPTDPGSRALVDRYIKAFENADVAALERLLTDDVILEMPPVEAWFIGREHYGRFIARIFAMRGTDWRMIPTSANGQPAVGAYVSGEADSLQVFTITGAGISHNVVFHDSSLFPVFGLPIAL